MLAELKLSTHEAIVNWHNDIGSQLSGGVIVHNVDTAMELIQEHWQCDEPTYTALQEDTPQRCSK
jgi:hypothetical protein